MFTVTWGKGPNRTSYTVFVDSLIEAFIIHAAETAKGNTVSIKRTV